MSNSRTPLDTFFFSILCTFDYLAIIIYSCEIIRIFSSLKQEQTTKKMNTRKRAVRPCFCSELILQIYNKQTKKANKRLRDRHERKERLVILRICNNLSLMLTRGLSFSGFARGMLVHTYTYILRERSFVNKTADSLFKREQETRKKTDKHKKNIRKQIVARCDETIYRS